MDQPREDSTTISDATSSTAGWVTLRLDVQAAEALDDLLTVGRDRPR